MASFQFRGSAIGQNATDIVIDDVNDISTAQRLAEARYPGYKITNGMKLGGGGYTASAPSASSSSQSYVVGGVTQPTQTTTTRYTPEPATGSDGGWGGLILGIAWDVSWMTVKYAIKCCIETIKFGLNYVIRPVLFGTSYVLRHSVHSIAVVSIWTLNKVDELTTDTAQLIESGTAKRWQF